MMRLIVLEKIKSKINTVNSVKISVNVNKIEIFKNHK